MAQTLHYTEINTLQKLAKAGEMRFSELKSPRVESNAFTYHLKKLTKQGFITKTVGGYMLSSLGKRLVDSLSGQTLKVRIQPKIITIVVCENAKGEQLLYKKSKEPFKNLVSFPYGKIHLGESVLEGAERELLEKTALRAHLCHVGDLYLLIKDASGDVLSHSLAHVFYTKDTQGVLKGNKHYGEFFWGKVEECNEDDFVPGVLDMFKLVKNDSNFFFKELEYTYT